MGASLNVILAKRYALGSLLLAGLMLLVTFKFIELALQGLIEGEHLLGLLRTYLLIALIFSPWFLLTWSTRLSVSGDQVRWRQLPSVRSFTFQDITSLERIDKQGLDEIPKLAISYQVADVARRVVLTPFIFPRADVEAFLRALHQRRGDLPALDLSSPAPQPTS